MPDDPRPPQNRPPGRPANGVAVTRARELFLKHYAANGHIGNAAKYAGISRFTIYHWREDPDFARDLEAARRVAFMGLEDEAWRRAKEGWIERYIEGVAVRKYSDTLMLRLLAAGDPAKYRDSYAVALGAAEPSNASSEVALATRLAALLETARKRRDGELASDVTDVEPTPIDEPDIS